MSMRSTNKIVPALLNILVALFGTFSSFAIFFLRLDDQTCTLHSKCGLTINSNQGITITSVLFSIPFVIILNILTAEHWLIWCFHQAIHYRPQVPLLINHFQIRSNVKLGFVDPMCITLYLLILNPICHSPSMERFLSAFHCLLVFPQF